MINWTDFESAVCTHLGRDITRGNNPGQSIAISSPLNQSLFIVAGPGSGKTTAISLRVLKLIFVDDVDPSEILVTTFTKKAASELKSRILGWGDQLRRFFIGISSYDHVSDQLRRINFNRIITGTLDSISEQVLTDNRAPGTPPPVVIEDFASNTLMTRVGLFSHGRHNNQDLKDYIAHLNGTSWRIGVSEVSSTLQEIKDRFCHDQIDVAQYRSSSAHPGVPIACDAIEDYEGELYRSSLYDFARLEKEFLEQLRARTLRRFLDDVRFVLVDEYQDTNLLQEQIYFELAIAAIKNGGSIAVVGDDDQSLYRFRGATVDLFHSFPNRIINQVGVNPALVYLSHNYRSTNTIVDFCNAFIDLDRQFQNVRVAGKPEIIPARFGSFTNYPVLGMFRDNVDVLACDLARFIHRVIYGGGFQVSDSRNSYTIRIDPQGSPADIALLFSSPQELDSEGNPRLPLLLRYRLSQLSPPIQVFNPRGQKLEVVPDIRRLCGLVLECIDPNSVVQNSIQRLPHEARNVFDNWRRKARTFINSNPAGTVSLRRFVRAWQKRIPLGKKKWEQEAALVDLIYKLITWIPNMQNDIESIVYLEAITRTVIQSSLFSHFRGEITFDPNNPRLEQLSIKEALWYIFMPLATGAIEVNEELFETLPNDRINVMSIHQAKGLEFPMVIVDVGSDFRTRHFRQAFKRFPRQGGKCCNMEDELRRHSQLGQPRRTGRDRSFDDLIRQYFVAYSRAQDVLMLVGLKTVTDFVEHVATGWDRNGNRHWPRGLTNLVYV